MWEWKKEGKHRWDALTLGIRRPHCLSFNLNWRISPAALSVPSLYSVSGSNLRDIRRQRIKTGNLLLFQWHFVVWSSWLICLLFGVCAFCLGAIAVFGGTDGVRCACFDYLEPLNWLLNPNTEFYIWLFTCHLILLVLLIQASKILWILFLESFLHCHE